MGISVGTRREETFRRSTSRDDTEVIDALMARLAPSVPRNIEDITRAAFAVGRRRSDVTVLARACGIAPRTLHWRLASAGSMTARRMLAWSLALHAAWRCERLSWNIKRTASASGFDTRNAFANYMRRNVAIAPSELARRGAFDLLCERFLAEL